MQLLFPINETFLLFLLVGLFLGVLCIFFVRRSNAILTLLLLGSFVFQPSLQDLSCMLHLSHSHICFGLCDEFPLLVHVFFEAHDTEEYCVCCDEMVAKNK